MTVIFVVSRKKPSGSDPIVGDYYLPSATRPLSLVNTDNRLIASALRIAIEPAVEMVISSMQRGFLRGRQMLAIFGYRLRIHEGLLGRL